MKKLFVFLLTLAFICVPSLAHSGKTDGNGGHNGPNGYHYHHGFEAHQHPNGVCPFDFEDRTNHNFSIYNKEDEKLPISSTEPHSSTTVEKSSKKIPWWLSLFAISFLACYAIGLVYSIFCAIANIFDNIKNKIEKRKKFNQEKEQYTALYGEKNILDLIELPEGTEIGSDNLPREINASDDWGKTYTIYLTKYGHKYHAKKACAKNTYPIHVYHSYRFYKCTPCSRCNPKFPDLDWYREYLKIQEIKKKYNIK